MTKTPTARKKNGAMPARQRNPKPSPIYAWRLRHNFTQTEAAEKFGVSLSTFRRLELTPRLSKKYALVFSQVKQSYP